MLTVSPRKASFVNTGNNPHELLPTSTYSFWHIVDSYIFMDKQLLRTVWMQYLCYLIQIIMKHYYHLMQRAICPNGQVEYLLYELSGTKFDLGGYWIWELSYQIYWLNIFNVTIPNL